MSNATFNLDPVTVEDFAMSDPTSLALLTGLVSGRLPFPMFGKNAICLWGTYGTGKTTLAKLLPKLLEQCPNRVPSSHPGILFGGDYYTDFTPCGSSANSVTMMQELKKRVDADATHSSNGWHYEIFDEIDLLTTAAQASLKATITQSTSTVFIFTTNHLNKVDRGLIDRAHLIEMNQPHMQEMVRIGRLMLIRLGMADSVDEHTLGSLAEKSRGSMRDFGNAVVLAAFSSTSRGMELKPV